ncbi:MAG: hypothetical protein KC455_10835 [Carnobacterium sp.]|nr:hypothetical protein [Carnobacterium sp.]
MKRTRQTIQCGCHFPLERSHRSWLFQAIHKDNKHCGRYALTLQDDQQESILIMGVLGWIPDAIIGKETD